MELHVRIVSARNLIDKQTFGRQDPYCKVSVGNRKFRTRVHDNGDRSPVWNEKFVFQVYDPQLEQLHIQVKDKNFTASVLIGEVRLPVNMFLNGAVTDQWYTINNGSKRAGDLNLRVQLIRGGGGGNGMQVQGYAAAAPVAYGGYAQAPPPSYAALMQPQYAQQPPQPQYIQQPQPQYAPPPSYAVAPPAPPPVYYMPPPVIAAPPPVMMAPPQVVYAPASYGAPGYFPQQQYGHHGHDGGGYYGGGGYGGGYGGHRRGGGMDGGDMALGVGAGVVGGLLLGEALDGFF